MGSNLFFENQRRKVELLDWDPLMNAQSEKRIRLDLLMPLTGQSLLGMPDFIAPAFESMEKEGSAIDETDISTELEGICFEAFSTDTHKKAIEIDTLGLDLVNVKEQLGRRFVKFTNSTLRSFKLVRKEETVCLKFTLTVKADAGLVLWAHHYHGGTFWATFDHSTVPMKVDDSAQMQLTNPALLPKEGEKAPSTEDCGYADGKGQRCILAEHQGDHEMAPITQEPAARKRREPAARKRRETAAVTQ